MPNRIMAHMVAFYPDETQCLEVARALVDGGATYLELQFPFSDPTADGPVIQRACSRALKQGFTVQRGLRILERIRAFTQVPVFVMSYANLAVRRGTREYARRCKEAGAFGLIVPDLPPDLDEGLYAAGKAEGLHVVPVVVPTITDKRLALVRAKKPAFIYAALRKGITGAATRIGEENLSFLSRLADGETKIMAGFGISERGQVEALAEHVHAVIIGSAFVAAAGGDEDGRLAAGSPAPSPYVAVLSKIRGLV
jgi:tryptophan synthase alpha chain